MPILLKFENGLKGPSGTTGYEDWIPVTSVDYMVMRDIHSQAGGKNVQLGNPTGNSVTIRKPADITSPGLFQQACCGKEDDLGGVQIHYVHVEGVDGDPMATVTYTLEKPVLTSFCQSGEDDGKSNINPTDEIVISFSKMKMKFVWREDGAEEEKEFDFRAGKS